MERKDDDKCKQIKDEFEQTEKLYHFTSFDTALKILESHKLRYGRLNNMNDIHESGKIALMEIHPFDNGTIDTNKVDEILNEIYMYRQISLTKDKTDGSGKMGFDLHQMWGLYADKGRGVCLVFDKDKLTNKISKLFQSEVDYNENVESTYISHENDVVAEIEKNLKGIYFYKRKEWEHEQEYRIIMRCPNSLKEEYLYYGDALKYIIINFHLRNIDEVLYFKRLETLKKLCDAIPVLVYGNSIWDYALATYNGEDDEIIWDSEHGFNQVTDQEQMNWVLASDDDLSNP